MMNMDIPLLWSIKETLPEFSITDFIEKVYFPRLQDNIDKVVASFTHKVNGRKPTGNLLLPFEVATLPEAASMGDVRLMSKAFAIIWNWENEVSEIIGYFSVKLDVKDIDGNCKFQLSLCRSFLHLSCGCASVHG